MNDIDIVNTKDEKENSIESESKRKHEIVKQESNEESNDVKVNSNCMQHLKARGTIVIFTFVLAEGRPSRGFGPLKTADSAVSKAQQERRKRGDFTGTVAIAVATDDGDDDIDDKFTCSPSTDCDEELS